MAKLLQFTLEGGAPLFLNPDAVMYVQPADSELGPQPHSYVTTSTRMFVVEGTPADVVRYLEGAHHVLPGSQWVRPPAKPSPAPAPAPTSA